MAKSSLPITILTVAAVAACAGCAGPIAHQGVEPHLKSAHSFQVPVDFENVTVTAGHGLTPFYPYSTPHCPYFDRRSKMWLGAGLANAGGHGEPGSPIPAGREPPPPEAVPAP